MLPSGDHEHEKKPAMSLLELFVDVDIFGLADIQTVPRPDLK
jgi:hypothetical protein